MLLLPVMKFKGYDTDGFGVAVRFLTLFNPWGGGGNLTRDDAARALPFFPAAGLVAGAVSAAVAAVLSPLAGAGFAAAAIAVAALAVATRGLHLDGVGDCFDALHYYGDPQRARGAMKDKSLGAFGAAGVAFVVSAKIAALGSVSPDAFLTAVVLVPAAARLAPAFVSYLSDAPPAGGLGAVFSFGGDGGILLRAFALAFAVAVFLGGAGGVGLVIAVSVSALLLALFFKSAFGSPGGDVHGATVELCEVIGFMVAGTAL